MTEEERDDALSNKVGEAYENYDYKSVLDIYEEKYDVEEAFVCALNYLQEKLANRIYILNRIQDLYRKNNVDELPKHERKYFIYNSFRKNWKWWWKVRDEHALLEYPTYRLNIHSYRKSKREIWHLDKWHLKSVPEWFNWEDNKDPYQLRKHSSGCLVQYLGEDGTYSTYNSDGYEEKFKFYNFVL
jgi:hypothetical protein